MTNEQKMGEAIRAAMSEMPAGMPEGIGIGMALAGLLLHMGGHVAASRSAALDTGGVFEDEALGHVERAHQLLGAAYAAARLPDGTVAGHG